MATPDVGNIAGQAASRYRILIYGALLLLSAAATVVNWRIEKDLLITYVAIILLLIIALEVVIFISNQYILKLLMSIFTVSSVCLYSGSILISAVFPGAGLPPSYCIIWFWRPCVVSQEKLAGRLPPVQLYNVNAVQVPVELVSGDVAIQMTSRPASGPVVTGAAIAQKPQEDPPPKYRPVFDPGSISVTAQYGGLIKTTDIGVVMENLKQFGWHVEAAGTNATRNVTLRNTNEIRYSNPSLVIAADLLSKQIAISNITGGNKPRLVLSGGAAAPGARDLEVWITKDE